MQGLLASRRVGTARFVRADHTSPYAGPLTELVARSFGPIAVLVVGTPDADDLHDATVRVERVLGREVNTVVVAADLWKTQQDPLLKQIRSRPTVIVLEQDEEMNRKEPS